MKMLRNALVAGLLAAAWFLPEPPTSPPSPPAMPAPSAEMQQRVAGVTAALRSAAQADRCIWSEVWKKAAVIARADGVAAAPLFPTTDVLRQFNAVSLNIAWRRIGGNKPGKYEGLAEAAEQAFSETLGLSVRPVSDDVRSAYVELCEALAWSGSTKE